MSKQTTAAEAPYAGWSPIPGEVPAIQHPVMQPPLCPLLPVSCGPCARGKCVVPAQQPVVPIPVYQEIQRKDRVIEVPETLITDKIIPKLYKQEVTHEVPQLSVLCSPSPIRIPRIEFKEKVITVPVPVAFKYKVESKWEIREVPKIIPKYTGKQEEIYVEVPQVEIRDRQVEKETPVYVGEKIVKRQVIEEEPVDVVQYKYVEVEEEVPVYKYKPVFDVEVDIPPPLIVPVPVQPKEIQLAPERISLTQWKRMRLGGASACCNQHACCGPDPANPALCCRSCATPWQPGQIFSPGGFCGTCCGRPACGSCQGEGCSACCPGDTGATGPIPPGAVVTTT